MEKKMGVGVGVIILRGGKILLGKRNADPEKASSAFNVSGTWTLPGGKMEFGESFEGVARREVKEETGIDVRKLKLISLTNDATSQAHFVTLGFVCENFSGEPEALEPDEIVEWRWFPLERLPSPIYFISEKMIRNYVSNVLYSERA